MSRRRFSVDGDPYDGPSRRVDALRDWLSLTLPILTVAAVFAAFWLIWQATLTPVPTTFSAPPMGDSASVASPSVLTFPPQMIVMAEAISTSLAPTPEPTPTPRPTAVMTPAGVAMVCGPGVAEGGVCTMPTLSPPSPTPLPMCPTTPGFDCIWMGSQMGTPVAISGARRGT